MTKIAFFSILGKPLIFWLGLITFFLLIITAIIGLNKKRIKGFYRIHKGFAVTTVIFALIHGILSVSVYLF
ncbi:hypothetical protein WKV44_06085 [Spirochaetia bacterium 38H-sp]|uniref:Uncharacterized protein n=1 Tax=Rarispira pelagica TaxID=3141764 RepID=A0ABU9UBR2_9SPIR